MTLGYHPSEVSYVDDDLLLKLRSDLNHKKVVGLGEIGLDYYWNKENKLREEVNLQISKLTDKKFLEFLLPRLKAFKDKTIGYPANMTFEEYEEYLQSIINEIETKGTCTLIYENFNSLWN